VEIPDAALFAAARVAIALGVDGHRADITLVKTAQVLAAWHGQTLVGTDELREAARLSLSHRMRRKPFEDQSLDWEKVEGALADEG